MVATHFNILYSIRYILQDSPIRDKLSPPPKPLYILCDAIIIIIARAVVELSGACCDWQRSAFCIEGLHKTGDECNISLAIGRRRRAPLKGGNNHEAYAPETECVCIWRASFNGLRLRVTECLWRPQCLSQWLWNVPLCYDTKMALCESAN